MGKIALILFGISYYENYKHWSGMKTIVDFRLSFENYKKFIYDYFINLGYNIDVYYQHGNLWLSIKGSLRPKYC
jgi:hypothetical protein